MVPLTKISNTELVAQPNSATDIPFLESDVLINSNEKSTQFFYSTNYNYDDQNRNLICKKIPLFCILTI